MKPIPNNPSELFENFTRAKIFDDFYGFCSRHTKGLYIYGNGEIGKGVSFFLRQNAIAESGIIESSYFDVWRNENYQPGSVGIIVGVGDKHLEEISENLSVIDDADVFIFPADIREYMGERTDKNYIRQNLTLAIHLCCKCNLNCKSCRNFSPLCREPDFYDEKQLFSEIEKIREIGLAKFKRIFISGGEPTLHPRLFEILLGIRRVFADSPVLLVTNGIILNKWPEKNWDKLREASIILSMTDYPELNIFESNVHKAELHGVDYNRLSIKDNRKLSKEDRKFVKFGMDFNKTSPRYSNFLCRFSCCRDGISIYRGRIYPCTKMFYSKHFSDAFGKKFDIEPGDYLDIFDSDTTKERVLDFVMERYPFCGYCDMSKNDYVDWGISERKIEEWT
jgi:organic radical activating enzyme